MIYENVFNHFQIPMQVFKLYKIKGIQILNICYFS